MSAGDSNMISDAFWLNLGAEVVYKSLDNRIAAVERLQKTIVWIFGIYSTISIGSAVFTTKESWDTTALLLFGLAFLFLIISYWVATNASFPQVQDFYGNAAASIRDKYVETVKRSTKAFTNAIVLCSVGVLLYSVALFLHFGSPAFNKNHKAVVPKVVKESDSLSVHVNRIATNKFALQIQSRKNSWVSYTLRSDTTVDLQTKTVVVPFTVQSAKINVMWLHIDTTTRVNQIIEVVIRPEKKYQLLISRTDTLASGSVLYTVSKKIKLTP
jgi:hypothetical protein